MKLIYNIIIYLLILFFMLIIYINYLKKTTTLENNNKKIIEPFGGILGGLFPSSGIPLNFNTPSHKSDDTENSDTETTSDQTQSFKSNCEEPDPPVCLPPGFESIKDNNGCPLFISPCKSYPVEHGGQCNKGAYQQRPNDEVNIYDDKYDSLPLPQKFTESGKNIKNKLEWLKKRRNKKMQDLPDDMFHCPKMEKPKEKNTDKNEQEAKNSKGSVKSSSNKIKGANNKASGLDFTSHENLSSSDN